MAIYVVETSRRADKDRYREFVKSILSENIVDYSTSVEAESTLPESENEDFEDLSNVDEKILITKLQEEIVNKQNEYK